MNRYEYAKLIDGNEYMEEVAESVEQQSRADGIFIVFGGSDDQMVFCGAIDDEIGCFGGGTACLTETGLLENKCEDMDCPYFLQKKWEMA